MPIKARLRIAFRNTFRNRRRSALNLVMIVGGVSAVILFRGFSFRILHDLREASITTQTGHIELATNVYWDETAKTPKEALIGDAAELEAAVRRNPAVVYVAGRLNFFGLVSTGEKSLSARGISLDPKSETRKNESLRIVSGERLSAEKPFNLLVGKGLAKKLGVTAGSGLTVLTYTYDGVINALDMTVGGVFWSNFAEVDDTTFILPFSMAQKLLDTDKVEQIVVGLDDTDHTDAVMAELAPAVASVNHDVRAKGWVELSPFYRQVDSFLGTQNHIFEFIILSLVLLGVLNTIGMSVFERAGEIGTVRALGDTEHAVLAQFLTEGFILGALGAVLGSIAGTVLAYGITALHLPIVIPSATEPMRIRIALFPGAYVQAIALALGASTFAAVLPALRASRMNIVDALRHNV